MKFKSFIFLLFIHLCNFCSVHGGANSLGTILFNTGGRPEYNFDIYTLPILNDDDNSYPPPPSSKARELKLTDGVSVNYNGYFPNSQSSPLSLLSSQITIPSSLNYPLPLRFHSLSSFMSPKEMDPPAYATMQCFPIQ
ncbi:hypothetical protein Ancab_037449 [Ancistrocladus abbreviatus]